MADKDKPKIELAPQEAIKFNYPLIELFIVHVMNIEPGFLITDESYVSDMRSFTSSQGKQINDHQWEFTQEYYQGSPKPIFMMPPEEREQYKKVKTFVLEKHEISFDEDLIAKTKELFGVEITSEDLKGSFVALGLKIGSQISSEKRAELMKLHKQLGDI